MRLNEHSFEQNPPLPTLCLRGHPLLGGHVFVVTPIARGYMLHATAPCAVAGSFREELSRARALVLAAGTANWRRSGSRPQRSPAPLLTCLRSALRARLWGRNSGAGGRRQPGARIRRLLCSPLHARARQSSRVQRGPHFCTSDDGQEGRTRSVHLRRQVNGDRRNVHGW